MSGLPYSTLGTLPVIPVEYCSTVGTVGDIMLVDLDQYLLVDRGQPEFASSIHVRFIQGETTFRATYEVDRQPTWRTALTPMNGNNTLSPFVALATRA